MTAKAKARHPVLDLLARYRAVLGEAWATRHELTGPYRSADEVAFLPAAQSLQDTPVHPAPRRVALVICLLFAAVSLWSVLGLVDVVAVAQGRIVVSDRTKVVQPLDTSVVSRVLVKDGDSVTSGQVLIELDATVARADQHSLVEQLRATDSELQRTEALLAALAAGGAPTGAVTDATLLRAEWQDVAARLAKLDAERSRREAELGTVGEAIAKLEAMLPLARQREADVKGLVDQGFMNQHLGQDRARERLELERDLALQRARRAEAEAALLESRHHRTAFQAETVRALHDRQAQARLKREQLLQERSKTDQRSRLTQLVAPADGVVQQLAVHAAGSVVTPAQALMVIVPQDAEVTAEVVLENKDVGFVRAGQAAEVKLETFPFSRYGTVPATVARVSADAVTDDKRGAIFPVVLTLGRTHLDVDGSRIALAPGMNVSAEVKTGRRRVIDYLLSPVQRAAAESLKER